MKLSAAEYEIMECVWALGRPVSGMDIMRALGQEKGWKQPTVLTFLSRLVEKGLLETEKRGKLRSYTAAMTREAYKNSETRDFLAQLYGGSIQNMVACMADGGGISAGTLARIPFSIVLGILAGAACGSLLAAVFRRLRLRDSAKVLILLSISFLLVTLEDSLSGRMGFSGLIAVVAAGVALQRKRGEVAARLSAKYAKLWVAAELLLFVLVGATVDLRYAAGAGTKAVLLIFLVLLFRMLGVWVCLLRTRLSLRECAFCMLAYCPKATVQAAIGSIPLGMGLACGDIVLTVAVLSILITAPLGAFAIDCTYQRLLKKN